MKLMNIQEKGVWKKRATQIRVKKGKNLFAGCYFFMMKSFESYCIHVDINLYIHECLNSIKCVTKLAKNISVRYVFVTKYDVTIKVDGQNKRN